MTVPPIPFVYEGAGQFIAASTHFVRRCDEAFKKGQRYFLLEHQERSANSHNHYFASLHEAWLNLPEMEAVKYPDSVALRKRALIMTGWRNETVIACESDADAARMAALVETLDPFAVVILRGSTVTILRAKSQSKKAMGNKDFQQSKSDVLAWVWNLVGVDPATGNKEAGQAA